MEKEKKITLTERPETSSQYKNNTLYIGLNVHIVVCYIASPPLKEERIKMCVAGDCYCLVLKGVLLLDTYFASNIQ